MIVKFAKDRAARWVIEEASKASGFYGAYFAGSTNWMADDAPFPASSDVDVKVVVENPKSFDSFPDLQQRTEQLKVLLPTIWEVTEAIIATNPEIVD
jgi:hypothetical protein